MKNNYINLRESYTNSSYTQRFQNNDQFVEYEDDLSLSRYKSYLEANELQESISYSCLMEFEKTTLNLKDLGFVAYLQYLLDKKILSENNELFKELENFNTYAVENNLMHKKRKDQIKKYLIRGLFQSNAENIEQYKKETYVEIDYSTYVHNNFRRNYKNEVLNNIFERGGTIFLNKNAKISLRFSANSELKEYTKKQAEILLSNKLGYSIKITEDIPKYEDIDVDALFISNTIEGNSHGE